MLSLSLSRAPFLTHKYTISLTLRLRQQAVGLFSTLKFEKKKLFKVLRNRGATEKEKRKRREGLEKNSATELSKTWIKVSSFHI